VPQGEFCERFLIDPARYGAIWPTGILGRQIYQVKTLILLNTYSELHSRGLWTPRLCHRCKHTTLNYLSITRDTEPFDWYQRYEGIKSVLDRYVQPTHKVLMSGAGNSRESPSSTLTTHKTTAASSWDDGAPRTILRAIFSCHTRI
jgi:hypothetical protein